MANTQGRETLERLQKKAAVRFKIMLILTGILFVAVLIALGIYVFRTASPSDPLAEKLGTTVCGAGFVALCFGLAFYELLIKKAYRDFSTYFKQNYVVPLIRNCGYFRDLAYSPRRGFSYNEIRDSAVVACGESRYFHSEDLLSGTYQGIEFQYADVKTQHVVSSGKRREVRTIFEGQVMRFASFDETKRSMGHLQIFQKEFLSNVKGWTAKNKIETENEAFNRRFQVYSADPHNAFYILTPRMMEQILRLADEVKEQISLTFNGKILYVAITRSRNMFDGYIDTPLEEQTADIEQDIQLLCRAGDLLITEMEQS